MSGARTPVEPFDLVIIGGTGDLALRKLLPALFYRFTDGQVTKDSRVIGAARAVFTTSDYRAKVKEAIEARVAPAHRTASQVEAFLALLSYTVLDVAGDTGWKELAVLLGPNTARPRVFYLAVAPELGVAVADRLREHGLNGPNVRVVLEKPIGKDLESAAALNDAVGRCFEERQLFRIDHYLGKETVQNLIALRFGNALFEPLWNGTHIDHVQITVAETIGVQSRAAYYDAAGALRDMVQNHMLQLLCLVALEPPAATQADAIRDEKLKVLRALMPIDERNAAQVTVRGQYRAGAANGSAVPGYAEETGHTASGTTTETFVAIKTEIANWRWAGVPFYLRTGKRLAEQLSEIVVVFRAVPHSIFAGLDSTIPPNKLVIRLQPDEGVKLWLMIKDPGVGAMRLRRVPLDMTFATAFGGRNPDAYERLLMDIVRGDAMLFMRRDEVETAWTWIDPIERAWSASREPPRPYAAGTWGPSAAIALIERDGRNWNEDAS